MSRIVETPIIITLAGSAVRAFTPLKAGGGNASTDNEIVEDRYARVVTIENESGNDVFLKFGPRTGSIGTVDTTTAFKKMATGTSLKLEVDHRLQDLGLGYALSSLHLNGTGLVRVVYQERV